MITGVSPKKNDSSSASQTSGSPRNKLTEHRPFLDPIPPRDKGHRPTYIHSFIDCLLLHAPNNLVALSTRPHKSYLHQQANNISTFPSHRQLKQQCLAYGASHERWSLSGPSGFGGPFFGSPISLGFLTQRKTSKTKPTMPSMAMKTLLMMPLMDSQINRLSKTSKSVKVGRSLGLMVSE